MIYVSLSILPVWPRVFVLGINLCSILKRLWFIAKKPCKLRIIFIFLAFLTLGEELFIIHFANGFLALTFSFFLLIFFFFCILFLLYGKHRCRSVDVEVRGHLVGMVLRIELSSSLSCLAGHNHFIIYVSPWAFLLLLFFLCFPTSLWLLCKLMNYYHLDLLQYFQIILVSYCFNIWT